MPSPTLRRLFISSHFDYKDFLIFHYVIRNFIISRLVDSRAQKEAFWPEHLPRELYSRLLQHAALAMANATQATCYPVRTAMTPF
jgi:hypothetical protein